MAAHRDKHTALYRALASSADFFTPYHDTAVEFYTYVKQIFQHWEDGEIRLHMELLGAVMSSNCLKDLYTARETGSHGSLVLQ